MRSMLLAGLTLGLLLAGTAKAGDLPGLLDGTFEVENDVNNVATVEYFGGSGLWELFGEATCTADSNIVVFIWNALAIDQGKTKESSTQAKSKDRNGNNSLAVSINDVDHVWTGEDSKAQGKVSDNGKGKVKAQYDAGQDGENFEPPLSADDVMVVEEACADSDTVKLKGNKLQLQFKSDSVDVGTQT